jgi:hypothetical protein
MVELLSDAMARRRLRASREQMMQLTRAARSKRMELEAGVVAAWYDDHLARPSRAAAAAAEEEGGRARGERAVDGNGMRDRRRRGSRPSRTEREGRDSALNHLGSRNSGYGRSGRTHGVRNAAEEAMRAHELNPNSANATDAAATLGTFMEAYGDLGGLALDLSPEELALMSEENDIMTMLAQAEAALMAAQNGEVTQKGDDRQVGRSGGRRDAGTDSTPGSQSVDSSDSDSDSNSEVGASVDAPHWERDMHARDPARGLRWVAHHARVEDELRSGVHLSGLQTMLGDALTRGGGRTADVVREKHGLHARDTANYAHRDYDQERRAIASGEIPTPAALVMPHKHHTSSNTPPQSSRSAPSFLFSRQSRPRLLVEVYQRGWSPSRRTGTRTLLRRGRSWCSDSSWHRCGRSFHFLPPFPGTIVPCSDTITLSFYNTLNLMHQTCRRGRRSWTSRSARAQNSARVSTWAAHLRR